VTSPHRWQHVERIYHDALARDEAERAQFLRLACAGDEALQREVESLLKYASDAQAIMQAPAIEGVAPLTRSDLSDIRTYVDSIAFRAAERGGSRDSCTSWLDYCSAVAFVCVLCERE